MAKNTQPVLKRCKTLGLSPAVLGYSKSTKRQPKQTRRKQSEYGMQLNEKQKVKFIYGVLEKQFHHYYEKAERKQGITGEILLQELERQIGNEQERHDGERILQCVRHDMFKQFHRERSPNVKRGRRTQSIIVARTARLSSEKRSCERFIPFAPAP